jgi:hypothetical protein
MFPASIVEGRAFNVQPEGDSAIDVACWRATPGTVVVFGGRPLSTVFAGPNRVTALVPKELLAHKGRYKAWLQNDYGESNEIEFVVT